MKKMIILGFIAWALVFGAVANAAANCTIEVQAVVNGQNRVVVFDHPSFDLIREVKGGERPQLHGWPVVKNTCGGQADNGALKRPEVVAAFASTQNTALLVNLIDKFGDLSGKLDGIANDVKLLQMQLASVEERLTAEEAAVSEIKGLLKKCRFGTQKCRNLRRNLRQHKAEVKRLRNKRRSLRRQRRVKKNNWCETHRLYQVTRQHLWYRHGCGVESGGGDSTTTTTTTHRDEGHGGTSSNSHTDSGRGEGHGGTSANPGAGTTAPSGGRNEGGGRTSG